MASFSLMSVFFVAMGVGTITPALQNLAEAFPEVPFTTVLMLSTLPSLFIIPFTIIAGAVAGTKIGFKPLLIVSLFLFIIGGAAPYFMSDFNTILVSRAVFGIGLGILTPLGNAIVMKLFDGQQRANMLGLGTVIMNVGGIVLQLLAGILCSINVKYTWLAHLLAILSLVIVILFLPEPEKDVRAAGEKVKMPGGVYLLSTVFGIFFMLMYPMLLNMSTIIISSGLGNAAAAGTVLSMFTVGGMISGALFGKVFQIFKKYCIPVGVLTATIGVAFVNYSNSLLILTIGCFIVGFGLSILMPAIFMDIGTMVSPAGFAMASGILMAFMNIGGFISTFYMQMIASATGNDSPKFPIFITMICYAIIAVVWGFVKMREKPMAPPAPPTAPAV